MAPQVENPRALAPADDEEVMREQLEYLIEHTAHEIQCDCAECKRFLRVRAILLEIFEEPCQQTEKLAPRLVQAA